MTTRADKDRLRQRVALVIVIVWGVTLFLPTIPRTGIQVAMMAVVTWLFVSPNGNGHDPDPPTGGRST